MAKYQRIKGGEKNENSGKRWQKSELAQVLEYFLSSRDVKIHEHNTDIQKLSKQINRTVRSVEAQLLMFRNLSKHGDYSYGNMNKLCVELWKEYLNSHKP